MPQKIPNITERKLLAVILRLHAEDGPIPRNILSVKARGEGIEVARSLLVLKQLGLVEDRVLRPGILRRLFGAKSGPVVLPTAEGLAFDLESETTPTPAKEVAPEPAPEEKAQVKPADEAADPSAPEPLQAPEPLRTEATAAPVPPAAQEPAPAPALPEIAPVAAAPAPQTPSKPEVAPVAAAPAPQAAPQAPVPPAATPAPRSESRQAVRARLDAFTEDLGGTPIYDDIAAGSAQVAPDVMEGLRETLALHGMDLTGAGEALIGDRMAKGALQGEALCQVVLFAFAHAVQHDALGDGAFQPGALKDYAVNVMRALEELRNAGEIRDDHFEEDMRQLWAVVADAPDGPDAARQLLADPIGGMAPTAVLPEDMLRVEEGDDGDGWPN